MLVTSLIDCVLSMGSWKLEVFRMSVYMLFPVGLFYYFNHPEFYQDHVSQLNMKGGILIK